MSECKCNDNSRDELALRTTSIKSVKFKSMKTRTSCQYVGYIYYSVNLNWAAQIPLLGRMQPAGLGLDIAGSEGLHIFHSKNVGEPIEYFLPLGVCRCHAWISLFWLRIILIVLFVTKQYQPFPVRTGGDALMKVPCSGLLLSTEVGLCYLRKWRRGESLLFISIQAQSM